MMKINTPHTQEKLERSSNKISDEVKEIKSLVYWLVSKEIQLSKRLYFKREHYKKFWNLTTLDEEIEKNQVWKLLERVIIEYFYYNCCCKLTDLNQEKYWIDFIVKLFNIKIWIDFSINQNYDAMKYKMKKINNTACDIDNDKTIWTNNILKRPDLIGNLFINIPHDIRNDIVTWFKWWKDETYKLHWLNYTFNEKIISDYFNDVISQYLEVLKKTIWVNNLTDANYVDDWYNFICKYDSVWENFNILIYELTGNKVLEFSVSLTNKYFSKMDSTSKVNRKYSYAQKWKWMYKTREKEDIPSQNSLWLYEELNIDELKNLPQNIINKIK